MMRKLLELLPEFLPDTFKVAGFVAPLGPARGNWLENKLDVRGLALIFEQLRVFVVLNAIGDGFQPYPRRRLGCTNWYRTIKKNPVARSRHTGTTSVRMQVDPTSDGLAPG